MTSNGWWMLAGTALLLGAGVGAWLTLRVVHGRHAAQLLKVRVDEHRATIETELDAALVALASSPARGLVVTYAGRIVSSS